MTAHLRGSSSTDAPRTSHGFGPMALGSLVSGIAGYAIIALGARAVGEALFAPVSVLWSLWALSVAAISFPVQHWTIRSAEAGGESAVWPQVPRLIAGAAGLTAVMILTGMLLGTQLFPSSPAQFSTMAALLPLGAIGVGLQRGILTHRRRFRAVSALIAGENSIRAIVALAVLSFGEADRASSVALGWGIIGGFLIVSFDVTAFRPRRSRREMLARTESASVGLLGGFASANVAAQAVLTAAPVVLALFAAPERVITEVFSILALLRVPYTGFVGASAAVTGPLSRLIDGGRGHVVRTWELRSGLVVAILALLAFLMAPAVLPSVVGLLFSTEVTIAAVSQGLLAAGGVLALAALIEMLVLLARHQTRLLVGSWSAALLVAAGTLTLPIEPVRRVATAFVLAEAVALLAMVANTARREGTRAR